MCQCHHPPPTTRATTREDPGRLREKKKPKHQAKLANMTLSLALPTGKQPHTCTNFPESELGEQPAFFYDDRNPALG